MSEVETRVESDEKPVGYLMMEPENLLSFCLDQLAFTDDQAELTLRGTIPRKDFEDWHSRTKLLDPKGMGARFTGKRIYLDSWAELLVAGSIAQFFDTVKLENSRWFACVGIESAYRESSLREKYLGDGAVFSRELAGRQIIQTCTAQNIRGESASRSLQQEIILRLQDKLSKAPSGPKRILAVMPVTLTDDVRTLDFSEIASETIGRSEWQNAYGYVFCIMLTIRPDREIQIVVIPIKEFLPGGGRVIAILPLDFWTEPNRPA
jgi:hypothetical protein